MNKKQALVISILLHALLLVAAYVFQGVIFPFMRLGGLVPLLLPVAGAGIALYEGRYTGGIAGLFAGILCDISFNAPVGTFTVFLTLTGLGIGTLADAFILPGFVTYYLSCFIVLVISAFIQMFPLVVLQGIAIQVLIGTAIQKIIYSLIFALPMWFLVRGLGKRSQRTPASRRLS